MSEVAANNARDILEQALSLSPEDRAALADCLFDSLGDDAGGPDLDKGYEEAWQAELLKRMAEVESGSVKTAPWAEVRQRLARRLK